MVKTALEGLLLGLGIGGTCAAWCAPVLVPLLLAGGDEKPFHKARVFAEFLAGRLVAYLLVAMLAAYAGKSLGGLVPEKAKALLLILASLGLMAYSIWSLYQESRGCPASRLSRRFGLPLAMGFVMGLNLCPPFAVAVVRAMEMANVARASLYFLFLFIGTSLFLLPLPLSAAFLKAGIFRRLGGYLGILAGLWFLIQGASKLL